MAATLTPDDIKLLKEVFATKEDLARFVTKEDVAAFATKDDLKQLSKGFDGKLEKLSQTFDQKLDDMKTAILDGVRSYLETSITPLLHNHEKRIHRVETHLDLPPLPTRGQ